MASGNSVVTRKGQVTIPADVRRSLGLKHGDRVTFTVEDGHARLAPLGSITERTAGVFKTNRRPMTAKQLRKAAEEAIAEDVMRRAGS